MPAVVGRIEEVMRRELAAAQGLPNVADVRVLGAIGVIQTHEPVDVGEFQRHCVERGVWIRPFGCNVYIMPQYIITDEQLTYLCRQMVELVK